MKVIKVIKKAIKWYFMKAYAWTPSCTIPYVQPK